MRHFAPLSVKDGLGWGGRMAPRVSRGPLGVDDGSFAMTRLQDNKTVKKLSVKALHDL